VRALKSDSGEVCCEGVAVHAGRRTATSEAKLFDSKGRLIAHGSESCLIMSIGE
jgi:acyl-coenzyme A thioesterase PaaI-like protein